MNCPTCNKQHDPHELVTTGRWRLTCECGTRLRFRVKPAFDDEGDWELEIEEPKP